MPHHSSMAYKDAVNRNAEIRHKYHGGGQGTLYTARRVSLPSGAHIVENSFLVIPAEHAPILVKLSDVLVVSSCHMHLAVKTRFSSELNICFRLNRQFGIQHKLLNPK